jgi:hypothetical protein
MFFTNYMEVEGMFATLCNGCGSVLNANSPELALPEHFDRNGAECHGNGLSGLPIGLI